MIDFELAKQINSMVEKLDNEHYLSRRERAITESARLFIYLTHDEWYDPKGKSRNNAWYDKVSDICRDIIEHNI